MKRKIPVFEDAHYRPDTGYNCSICFEVARVWMIGECLCINHAKRFSHGYGETLKSMREEIDNKKEGQSCL
jgi:hypothetical protein